MAKKKTDSETAKAPEAPPPAAAPPPPPRAPAKKKIPKLAKKNKSRLPRKLKKAQKKAAGKQ